MEAKTLEALQSIERAICFLKKENNLGSGFKLQHIDKQKDCRDLMFELMEEVREGMEKMVKMLKEGMEKVDRKL